MVKSELRKKYKELRNSLTDNYIEEQSLAIANRLLSLPIWEKSYYHIFLSISSKKEINTSYILHILQGKDKNIIISKSNFQDLSLQHFLLTDTTVIRPNHWGIPEPEEGIEVPIQKIDVVFIPLLTFDVSGNRVGYGKGFYDGFLAQCKPETLKIGLSFFEPEDQIDDISKSDIPLDFCITSINTYTF